MLALLLASLAGPPARAAVTITVSGVSAPLRKNVLAYLSFARYQSSKSLIARHRRPAANRIGREVQSALRPFGYFEPKVRSSVTPPRRTAIGRWRSASIRASR